MVFHHLVVETPCLVHLRLNKPYLKTVVAFELGDVAKDVT